MRTNMVKIWTLSGLLVCTQGFCLAEKPTRIKQLFQEVSSRVESMYPYVTERLLHALLETDTPLTSQTQKLEICIKALKEEDIKDIEDRINDAVNSIKKKEPQTLTAENEFGLTPAHELAFIVNNHIKAKNAGKHLFKQDAWMHGDWLGEDYFLDLVYAYLLPNIDSGKKVLAKKPPIKEADNPREEKAVFLANQDISSKYKVLEDLGITKTEMSPKELMKKVIEPHKDQWPKIWNLVSKSDVKAK